PTPRSLTFFFSFVSHVPLRHLHSFPTRRSSDLDFEAKWFDHWLNGADNGVENFSPVNLYTMGAEKWQHLPKWPLRQVLPLLGTQDRKSTRLNSSHVAISYAVFCLKKKKKSGPTL